MSDSYYHPLPYPHGLQPASLLSPWHFPSKNTGVGRHSLLHGIFPTQGSNMYLQYCRQILYYLSHQGNCWRLEVFFIVLSCFGKSIDAMVVELKSLIPCWMVSQNYCWLLKATCRSLRVGFRILAAKNFLACVKSLSNSEALCFPLLWPSGENSLLLKGLYDWPTWLSPHCNVNCAI